MHFGMETELCFTSCSTNR